MSAASNLEDRRFDLVPAIAAEKPNPPESWLAANIADCNESAEALTCKISLCPNHAEPLADKIGLPKLFSVSYETSMWQRIETAPMDVELLLYVPGFEYHGGNSSERVHAVGRKYGSEEGCLKTTIIWDIVNDADGGSVDYTPHKPTHWMTLPDPPSSG